MSLFVSQMFSGRIFPRYQTALLSHLQKKRILIESNSHFLGMRSNDAVKSTNNRYKGSFLQFKIWWVLFIEYIPSVVLRFLLNPFCPLASCALFHGLIRFKMILIISLHTVDPILSPLHLLGSDFDPFPFQRVLSLELP